MKISVIHASYGRPAMAHKTHLHWRHAAGGHADIEWILSIDKADPMCGQYKELANEMFNKNGMVITNETNTSVAAINHAAKASTGDILVVISDDFSPVADWDALILKAAKGKTDWIMKTQDGTQGWIITLPIMDRAYYNRFGYVYHPDYLHQFCDTELTAVADLLERKIVSDIQFKHNHYSVKGGIAKDNTSTKADATWAQGEALFIERYKRTFDLTNPPGKVRDQSYINWINQKLR